MPEHEHYWWLGYPKGRETLDIKWVCQCGDTKELGELEGAYDA